MSGTPADLSAILGKRPSELKEPQPLPTGIYIATVESVKAPRKAGQNENYLVDFEVNVTQALDVEVEAGELPKKMTFSQWLTEKSLFYFGQFLTKTLEIEESGRTLMEMLPEARGRSFKVEIKQEPYTSNGEQKMGNRFGRTFHIDADVA